MLDMLPISVRGNPYCKNLDTICGNISMLKTPPCDKDKQLFECIKLALYDAKEKLDETERRIEIIKSK